MEYYFHTDIKGSIPDRSRVISKQAVFFFSARDCNPDLDTIPFMKVYRNSLEWLLHPITGMENSNARLMFEEAGTAYPPYIPDLNGVYVVLYI